MPTQSLLIKCFSGGKSVILTVNNAADSVFDKTFCHGIIHLISGFSINVQMFVWFWTGKIDEKSQNLNCGRKMSFKLKETNKNSFILSWFFLHLLIRILNANGILISFILTISLLLCHSTIGSSHPESCFIQFYLFCFSIFLTLSFQPDSEIDLRLLIHQSLAGCVIGKHSEFSQFIFATVFSSLYDKMNLITLFVTIYR